MVTVYTDVTARKRAEEEQRVAAAMFQASAEPMLIADAQFRVERCNPAFEALLGYGRDEVVGRKPGHFVATERQDAALYDDLRAKLNTEGALARASVESSQGGRFASATSPGFCDL